MSLARNREDITANAFLFADSVYDGTVSSVKARDMVARGKVFFPFRYGNRLVFAPAKFIGYSNNTIEEYERTARNRSGSEARQAITKIFGLKAVEDDRLERKLDDYCASIGVQLKGYTHSFWIEEAVRRFANKDRSAINDLDPCDLGNDDPEYQKRMRGTYMRDQKVRDYVIARAAGLCEYCKERGFEDRYGRPFLETHHIISLSDEEPDKASNVIALCPTDHRRAHFGSDWQTLQTKFSAILKKLVA